MAENLEFLLMPVVFVFGRDIPPQKLTCQQKTHHWKMYFLLKLGIFQCHVSFQGSIRKKKELPPRSKVQTPKVSKLDECHDSELQWSLGWVVSDGRIWWFIIQVRLGSSYKLNISGVFFPLPMTDPWDERYSYLHDFYHKNQRNSCRYNISVVRWMVWAINGPKINCFAWGIFTPFAKVVSWGPVFAGDSTAVTFWASIGGHGKTHIRNHLKGHVNLPFPKNVTIAELPG